MMKNTVVSFRDGLIYVYRSHTGTVKELAAKAFGDKYKVRFRD